MENSDLLRRAEDLLRRCEKNDTLTFTAFLSPVERVQVERWAKTQPGCRLLVSGGHPECERCVAFFLPDYLEAEYQYKRIDCQKHPICQHQFWWHYLTTPTE